MAISTHSLSCGFDKAVETIHDEILSGSMSAEFIDGTDTRMDDVRFAVRVYERYSYTGSNRVSLNVTFFGRDGDVRVTGITSGGSQAVFFKINTFGEEAFLQKFDDAVESVKGRR